MKPLELKQRIDTHQSIPYFHPLTCGNDSNHESLIAEIVCEKVILKCPSCDYIQDIIPENFYHDGASVENQLKIKKQLDLILKGE